ncbi:aminoacyl-tRNA hydrolase [Oceanispirochaeta crateris]|uniref:Aminoacyl-tRNA hydrolase n=1 Tax=Oceanispirochaeta crateris TaxID=2518645 RepID=A0A5C1QJT8_9SPIO|nr:alternative ribosome rescue aminoacyl-tRNA hydrolase ArfB [Oceanispirochaeta crateris]QEN08403.1 aminoacyl-tRNA hydrolase [Oceanispirochaeta crateris]
MKRSDLVYMLEAKGQFSFSRSSGPGGQNVNKVNTKVLLTVSLKELEGFQEWEILKIREKLASRLNSRDELYVQLQEERSQIMNREKAVEKMADLIMESLIIPKKRRKTGPSRAARQKRMDGKKKLSHKKKNRGRVSSAEQ